MRSSSSAINTDLQPDKAAEEPQKSQYILLMKDHQPETSTLFLSDDMLPGLLSIPSILCFISAHTLKLKHKNLFSNEKQYACLYPQGARAIDQD